MRYKIGQYFINTIGNKLRINGASAQYYYTENGMYDDDGIDHEATAKLNTLPEPSKDMLRSGMKVVYRNGSVGYVLVEVGKIYKETGEMDGSLKNIDSCLKWRGTTSFDIVQIWDGDTLIAQRTEKSEAELKKESLEKQINECSDKIKNLYVCIENLELEIKSL